MWEIWTRRLPFESYRFDFQVEHAAIAGERPVVPEGCPSCFCGIMTDCWEHEAVARPEFSTVLRRLRHSLVELSQQ